MQSVGQVGRLGRLLASSAGFNLTEAALAILAKYGSAANLYLPGVGAISGITAGNWLDSAGTTADNPVGLVVSAGKTVGPELVTNGGFSSDATGWSAPAGWAIASEVCTATTTVASFRQIANPCIAGKFYLVEFDWAHVGGILYVRVGAGVAATFTTSGRKSVVLAAAGTQGFEAYGGAVSGVLDNISVRELPGAHLTQSTAANRPVLRQGSVNWLTKSDFQDGLSDAPIRSGLIAASSLTGYGGALAFGHDGSTLTYALKSYIPAAGTVNTVCVVVQMTDMAPPTWGSGSANGGASPFAIVGNGQTPAAGGSEYTVAALQNNTYLVAWTFTASGTVGNNGLYKYPANNARTFKATRYGLLQGSFTAQQIIDAGGIPVTTTAPASSTSGPFAWQFDGVNDGLTSTLTLGNAGFFCAAASVTDSGVLRTLLGAGASGDGVTGAWLFKTTTNSLRLSVGNGSVRNHVETSATYPANTVAVASAGWDASSMFVGINNTETSGAKSINCTSSNVVNIGSLPGSTAPMLGTIGATIVMPTVLPTPDERHILRKFIAKVSGI